MKAQRYNLRKRIPEGTTDKEGSSSEDERVFFDSSDIDMAELEALKTEVEALRRQVNTRLESDGSEGNAQRQNHQNPHIPKFTKHNPQLYFAQVERAFAFHNITTDSNKFDLIVCRLEEDILSAVEDLVTNPPDDNKYTTIKERLISIFAESSESKLRRLLLGGDTEGLKPSEILAHIRRLAPEKNNEAIIRTIFLGKMPETIRPLLTVWEDQDLCKLAKVADKMLEANNNAVSAIALAPSHSDTGISVEAVTPLMSMTSLCKLVTKLSDKIDKIQQQVTDNGKVDRRRSRPRDQSRYSDRSQSRDHSQSREGSTDTQLCWYHQQFGNAAKHCKVTCPRYNPHSGN